ncbi:MAG: hypothetical protein U0175_20615 [Caldilineaceae bacterium]
MRFTVEHLLYWIALLVAVALRLFALGAMPLHPHEAQNAWLAWLVATGQSVDQNAAPVSALYHGLQTLIFLPGFTSDAAARIVPALAGIALVALPWWWRSWLGRGGALALAFLLAIDPWMTAFSRMAEGGMLSIFLGMLALTALIQPTMEEVSELRWQRIGASALGLLLASGPLAWSFVPLIAIALWLQERERREKWLRQQNLLWAGGALLIAATGLLTMPQLMGAVSRSLSAWLSSLTSSANGYPISWWLVRLLADEPFALVFGAIGLVGIVRQMRADVEGVDGTTEKWLVLLWLLWGVILGVAPGRTPLALPMIGIPLLIGAALAVDRLVALSRSEFEWSEGRMLLAILVVLSISALFYTVTAISSGAFDFVTWQPVGLMVGLAMLLAVLYAVWLDSRQATAIVGFIVGGGLLAITFSANWHLNYRESAVTPAGLYATATHPDVRRLAKDVATISTQRLGDQASLPVLVELNSEMQPDPVLGWYLHASQVRWVPGAATGDGMEPAPLLITTQPDTSQAAIAETYMGSIYRVHYHFLPSDLTLRQEAMATADGLSWRDKLSVAWSAGWQARLRWLLYRENKTVMQTDEVTLWSQ